MLPGLVSRSKQLTVSQMQMQNITAQPSGHFMVKKEIQTVQLRDLTSEPYVCTI